MRFTALLLALLLLAGCTFPHGSDPVPAVPEESTVIPGTLSSAPEPVSDLLDGSHPVAGSPNLTVIEHPDLQPTGSYPDVQIAGDTLFILHCDYSMGEADSVLSVPFRLLAIDQQTGQLIGETSLETENWFSLQACGDQIALLDWGSKTVQILSKQLKPLHTLTLPENWSTCQVAPDGKSVYVSAGASTLEKMDIATGAHQPIVSDAAVLFCGQQYGSYLGLSYMEKDSLQYTHCVVDMPEGKLLFPPFSGDFNGVSQLDGLWMASLNRTSSNTYLIGRDADPLVLSAGMESFSLAEGPAPLFHSSFLDDGSALLSLYREDGRFYSSCLVPRSLGFCSAPMWSEARQGYFLNCSTESTEEEGKSGARICFWDPKIPTEGQDLSMISLSAMDSGDTGTAVPQDLYDRAKALSHTYQMDIRIADLCDTECNGFAVRQELDPWAISQGLTDLEQALRSYPKGFFTQLPYGEYSRVEISLAGALTDTNVPEDANGFTSFDAFVCHFDGAHKMVLDITRPNLVQTIYHEFSHIIDAKLEYRSLNRENALYQESQWEALNPADFFYANSVYHLSDEHYNMDYDGYFIDTYARTFPTEDRARILENAMIGNRWYFEGDFYAPLKEKLAYYCACIREGFDTTGWPEMTQWEEPLEGYTWKGLPDAA